MLPVGWVPLWLTHLLLDKMAAISQMIFLNAFSWVKMYDLRLNFTEICSQGHIMAWWRPGDKPLSEQPMMFRLLEHICVTRGSYIRDTTYHNTAHGPCCTFEIIKRLYINCLFLVKTEGWQWYMVFISYSYTNATVWQIFFIKTHQEHLFHYWSIPNTQ